VNKALLIATIGNPLMACYVLVCAYYLELVLLLHGLVVKNENSIVDETLRGDASAMGYSSFAVEEEISAASQGACNSDTANNQMMMKVRYYGTNVQGFVVKAYLMYRCNKEHVD